MSPSYDTVNESEWETDFSTDISDYESVGNDIFF